MGEGRVIMAKRCQKMAWQSFCLPPRPLIASLFSFLSFNMPDIWPVLSVQLLFFCFSHLFHITIQQLQSGSSYCTVENKATAAQILSLSICD
jgi:hypothetical protein